MSALVHLFADYAGKAEIEYRHGSVWVSDRAGNTVSLSLDAEHRAGLRAALDEADAAELRAAA